MRDLADYAEERLLEDAVGGGGFSHANVSMALIESFSELDLENGSWSGELGSGIGYTRQTVTWDPLETIGVGQGRYNSGAVTFGAASGEDWTVEGVAWSDNESIGGGNVLAYHELDSGLAVLDGETLEFPDRSFRIWATSDYGDFAESNGVDNLLGEGGEMSHSEVEMSLHTSDPGDTGTGGEISDTGYSRQVIQLPDYTFGHRNGVYQLLVNVPISFGPFDGPHFGISHTGLYTPGGDLVMSGALGSIFDVRTGDTYTFEANQLAFACG